MQGTEGPWAAAFAQALSGSPGLYGQSEPAEGEWWANNGGRKWKGGRAPQHSVNFVTAHDGFSLADLTAYNEKHNEANGEGNRSAYKVYQTGLHFYTVWFWTWLAVEQHVVPAFADRFVHTLCVF